MTGHALAVTAALLMCHVGAATAEPAPCYDAMVVARAVDQVPSEMPAMDNGDIVMEWPWFVDLDIDEVKAGRASTGVLRVLTIQHIYFIDESFTLYLRHNKAGGFNARMAGDGARLRRCPKDAAPERPFLSVVPGHGVDLDGLRNAGIAHYGHHQR